MEEYAKKQLPKEPHLLKFPFGKKKRNRESPGHQPRLQNTLPTMKKEPHARQTLTRRKNVAKKYEKRIKGGQNQRVPSRIPLALVGRLFHSSSLAKNKERAVRDYVSQRHLTSIGTPCN